MIHSDSGAIIGALFSRYVVGSNMLRDIELQDLMTAGGGSVSRPMVRWSNRGVRSRADRLCRDRALGGSRSFTYPRHRPG